MQILIWRGAGEGTINDPFILVAEDTFIRNQPFSIRAEANYTGWKQEQTYFKLNNDSTIYLLAEVVKDKDNFFFKSINAIDSTMILSEIIDYLDGPFIFITSGGLSYIVKQQVFSIGDVSYIAEIDRELKEHTEDEDNPHKTNADNAEYSDGISIKQKIDSNKEELDSSLEDISDTVNLSAENDWDLETIFTEEFANSRNGWVQVDNEIYIFGGSTWLGTGKEPEFSGEFAAKVYKYNVVTKQLTELSDLPTVINELRGVYKDGFIYLVGQDVGSVSDLDKTYKYEISTDTYTLITNPPVRIRFSSGAVLVDNKMYVFSDSYYTENSLVNTNTTPYIYDISSDSWSVGQPTNIRFDRGYAAYYNGLIYVQRSLKFQAYNPTTDTWITDLTPPTYGLVHTGVMQEYKGRLFIGSGWETSKAKNNPFIQYYDVAEDKWFVATRLEFKNHALGYGSLFLYDNKLYYIGGYSNEAEPNFNNVVRSFDLEKLQFEEIDYQRQLIQNNEDTIVDLENNKVDKTTYSNDKLIIEQDIVDLENDVIQLQTGKQDKLVAGTNITIDPITNVISSRNDEPDGVTIVLNEENKLEVSKNIEIDGGFL